MVTVWMAAVTTTTKSFSNDFKSRGDSHTFFRCKRLTSKEKSAKPAIPLRENHITQTHKKGNA